MRAVCAYLSQEVRSASVYTCLKKFKMLVFFLTSQDQNLNLKELQNIVGQMVFIWKLFSSSQLVLLLIA